MGEFYITIGCDAPEPRVMVFLLSVTWSLPKKEHHPAGEFCIPRGESPELQVMGCPLK